MFIIQFIKWLFAPKQQPTIHVQQVVRTNMTMTRWQQVHVLAAKQPEPLPSRWTYRMTWQEWVENNRQLDRINTT